MASPFKIERHEWRRGFSLIELLVMMAIVAVLVALSLPVMSRMKDAGNRAKCMSNLRVLGAAQMLFAAENNGRFSAGVIVRPSNGFPFGSGDLWQNDLLPYLGAAKGDGITYDRDKAFFIFNCPSVKTSDFTRLQTTYALNPFISNMARDWLGRQMRIQRPSQTILMVETRPSNTDYAKFVDRSPPTVGSPAFRHGSGKPDAELEVGGLQFLGGGVANTLFCDGHVRALPPEDLTHFPADRPSHLDASLWWP